MRVDAVTKRQFAFAVLVGIWGLKIHHVILHLKGTQILSHVHLGTWCLLDTLYFFGLWLLRIEWLDFRFIVCAALTFASCMIDMGLAGLVTERTAQDTFTGRYRQPGVVDHPHIRADIFNESHLLGSHVVHVLPPTFAKINPNASAFCLGFTEKSADIPVKIKGTPPWKISYEYYGFDGSYRLFDNITVEGSGPVPATVSKKETRIGVYTIPADKPGIYRLVSVREKRHKLEDEGKVLQPDMVEVVQCPQARLVVPPKDSGKEAVDRCVDQTYSLNILLSGTPPFTAWYLRKIGPTPSLVMIESGEQDGKQEGKIKSSRTIPHDVLKRLLAARTRDISLPVEVKVEEATEYLHKIVEVTDGRNNSVIFPPTSERDVPVTGHVVKADRSGDSFLLRGHSLPSARFDRCESVRIRSGFEHEGATINILLTGVGPWQLRYARSASEENAVAGKFESEKTVKDIQNPQFNLVVHEPGVYVLLSVSDKYCSGVTELPATCIVQKTLPPQISISAQPIMQECFGATGMDVNFSMTGEPPFWVELQVVNKVTGKRAVERKDFSKALHTLRMQPQEPGEYEYVFLKIGDAVYTMGVPVEGISFKQVIHTPSRVSVVSADGKRCIGDSAKVEVSLAGEPPWSLSYEITRGTTKTQYTKSNITQDRIVIETPTLDSPGTYVVDLTEIRDGNGCVAPVPTDPIAIEVLSQRPSAHFHCPKPIHFLENDRAKIPVVVSGHGKYMLKYKRAAPPGAEYTITGDRTIEGVTISEPGIYELTAFNDAYCSGRVVEPTKCQAFTIPKPKLEIPPTEYEIAADHTLQRKAVCENSPDRLELHLNGTPPFTIFYTHEWQSPSKERTESKKTAISEYENRVAQQFARISLVTDKPGRHIYKFTGIADGNYQTRIPLHHQNVLQQVHERPKAVFLDEAQRTFQCIATETDTELRIQLTGSPPFNLQVYRKHPSSSDPEILNLQVNTTLFTYRPEKPTIIGRYVYTIKSISDRTGCESVYEGTEPGAQVTVQVTDMARITMEHEQKVTCVGDMLSYTLEGTAPFTIGYQWNGVSKPDITVNDPVLMLLAAESGFVNVTRVCNAMKCCYQPPGGLVKEVNPLPRAIVDGGIDIIDDIREGDESVIGVEFEGTAPFSFRYTRTPLLDPEVQRRDPDESFTIENIFSNKYLLTTDKEGLFRVTWVKDRFCEFPPKKWADPKAANVLLRGSKKRD
ncbi:uncharacterized protein SPPG_07339 [Spizellomyces punctatus DAOM BR117]|uniref:Ig-like domain-containing protein n=1 Tax=Spizellomyces punctatus (strain DAOM BR117) TaxID=645134 RepID=A0A0L0H7A0_SPIPD|nr:uncharacterized protein SPPG_07339 [Spizellomyces punctatus DAOM BR117]KNC97415.1 hypothetical protein SPPG_07339 [Spizellomyces punctatus DAOM BR117]|eukprot:XP_016605455.1 hypothetical protein SPPG_07339 [Spizellomyces punctatus DAOM BR117]